VKAIVCEMCQSNQMRKENGFFVCQSCGTQYSVEEAKKLMVEIEGSVKIDHTDDKANLYIAARNACEASDYSTAVADYEMLTRMDPHNWEPVFYSVLLKAYNITNGEIASAASRISNGLPRVYEMLKQIPDEQKRKNAVKEVADQCYLTAKHLVSASHAFRDVATGGVVGTVAMGAVGFVSSSNRYAEDRERGLVITNIMLVNAELIWKYFDVKDPHYNKLCTLCYQMLIKFNDDYKASDKIAGLGIYNKETINTYNEKIKNLKFTIETSNVASEDRDNILKIERRKSQVMNQIKESEKLKILFIIVWAVGGFLLLSALVFKGVARVVLIIISIICAIAGFAIFQNYRNGPDTNELYGKISQMNKEIAELKRSNNKA